MKNRPTTLSIIIATRNRGRQLAHCLDALAKSGIDRDRHEIMIVDNAGSDNTPEVFEREMKRKRMRILYIREARVGLSYARNSGAERSSGEAMIFLDDDALAAAGWAEAFEGALCEGKSPIVQGRIIPLLPCARPAWLTENMLPRFGQADLGEEETSIRARNLHGGNLGVRRDAFDKAGMFRTELGAGAAGLGEDTEWGMRAEALGLSAMYAPKALVQHVISRSAVTRSAMLKRFMNSGYCRDRIDNLGAPVGRVLARFGIDFWSYLYKALVAGDAAGQIAPLCDLAEHLGRVVGSCERAMHG